MLKFNNNEILSEIPLVINGNLVKNLYLKDKLVWSTQPQNLLDYDSWSTTSQPLFRGNGDGNKIINDIDPFGNTTKVWQSINNDVTSDADGGFISYQQKIDNTKMYRNSLWVKRVVQGNGNFYLGSYAFDINGTNTGLSRISDNFLNVNPYYNNGAWNLELDTWYLIVSHTHPSGSTDLTHSDSGWYKAGSTTKIAPLNHGDYRMISSTDSLLLRTYLYYSTIPSTDQKWCYPRMEMINGREPSISELVNGFERSRVSAPAKNALDHYADGYRYNGVYPINPTGTEEMNVYCDMLTDGGGWMGIINIDGDSGNNRHWGDTSFWQGANTYGSASSFLSAETKTQAYEYVTDFSEIRITTHSGYTIKGRGIWTVLPEHQSKSFKELLNLPNTRSGTKITGNRTFQTGTAGTTNNPERSGNSNLLCEFTDAYGGYELRVNWYGDGDAFAKYSTTNDTVNYVRLTTGIGDNYGSGNMGYSHSYSGFGGHHERPRGSYKYDFDFGVYTEYCGIPPVATTNQSIPCGTINQYNIDSAIWIR